MNKPVRTASVVRHYQLPPSYSDPGGGSHWIARGANFAVTLTRAAAGTELPRDNPDEYMVLLAEGVDASFDAGGESVTVAGDSLVIVPPGRSRVVARAAGDIYRIFTSRCADLLEMSVNRLAYLAGAPDVAPLVDWPMPAGGYRLRAYPLARHLSEQAHMRVFRSRSLMVNVFVPQTAPRDPKKMTPHAHADFEQGALTLNGRHIHHLRYPWSADLSRWRDDEHVLVDAPSLTVIPSGVIHTTQGVGPERMRLVEVFAPPRLDFSMIEGRVCNAHHYPMPEATSASAQSGVSRMKESSR